MNRSQYEAIHGTPEQRVCRVCQRRQEQALARRRIMKRRADHFNRALRDGIDSGKVLPVFFQDAFTGWHYIDYKGRQEMLGPGKDY